MAHEISNSDGLVLHKQKAWHGLGTVVDTAPTPREALTLAGIDWGISQLPMYTKHPVTGEELEVSGWTLNWRQDNQSQLAVVRSSYQVVSNADMADFCEALLDIADGQVRCESAGSIRHGRKVWFLLKGDEFGVKNNDSIFPYILVSNGHDASAPFCITPTTVRVVCSNTLHLVTGYNNEKAIDAAYTVRHTTNVMERVEAAKQALKHYGKTLQANQELFNTLANKDVNTEAVQKFFLDAYQRDFGAITDNPTNKKEERARLKAMDAMNSFMRRFDDEKAIAGASMWNCFNAYSGLVQHDRKARGKDDALRIERRVESNLFGLNTKRTLAVFHQALQTI
jgi:phage/plasmid-like protein (TIGR03299 family)